MNIERNRANDRKKGIRLGEIGAALAFDNADDNWRAAAQQQLDKLIASGREFTVDDVTEVVGLPEGRNAVGGLFSSNSRNMRIVGLTKSTRPSAHGRRLPVWIGI